MGIRYNPEGMLAQAISQRLATYTFSYPAIMIGPTSLGPDGDGRMQPIELVINPIPLNAVTATQSDNVIYPVLDFSRLNYTIKVPEYEEDTISHIYNKEPIDAAQFVIIPNNLKVIKGENQLLIMKVNMNSGMVSYFDSEDEVFHQSSSANWLSSTPEEIAETINIDKFIDYISRTVNIIMSKAPLPLPQVIIANTEANYEVLPPSDYPDEELGYYRMDFPDGMVFGGFLDVPTSIDNVVNKSQNQMTVTNKDATVRPILMKGVE